MAHERKDAGIPVEHIMQDWDAPFYNKLLAEGLSGPQIFLPNEHDGQDGIIGKKMLIKNEQTGEPIISLQLNFDTNSQTLYVDELLIDESIVKKDHHLATGCVKRVLSNVVNFAESQTFVNRLMVRSGNEMSDEVDNSIHGKIYVANRAGFRPSPEQYRAAQQKVFDYIRYLARDDVTLATLRDVEDAQVCVRYGERLAEATGVSRPLSYDDMYELSNAEIAHMIVQGDIVPVDDNVELLPLAPEHKKAESLKIDAQTLLEILDHEQDYGREQDIFSQIKSTALAEDIHRQLDCNMELDLTSERAVKSAKGYLKGNMQEREAVKQAVEQAQGASR